MTKLKFTLSDNTVVTHADFHNAIRFCEEEFGYEGEAWELVKGTKNQIELHSFLIDDEIDVELVEE
ncbi:hypothetical protein D3C74_424780 [compost metagenome]